MMNHIRDFLKELHRRNPLFFYLGTGLSFLFFMFLLTFQRCQYSLSIICFWLKPCKFALSFALYVFTLGWFMDYLIPAIGKKIVQRITWGISLLIVVEIGIIFLQSSVSADHLTFSNETRVFLSRNLYLLGNAMIMCNTLIAAYIAALFFQDIPLQPLSYLWAIRAGFLLFILSSLLGAFLILRYGQTPPSPDSYGLPFTHFSSSKDYLVSLHFLGIHSLQLLPFLCYFFQNSIGKRFIISSTALYATLCLLFILS